MTALKTEEQHFTINSEESVLIATYNTKLYAEKLGFNPSMQTMIATAISELATNIIKYANPGYILIGTIKINAQIGIEAIAEDRGPGIKDRAAALTDNMSTGGTLGVGLPGVKRLIDEFYFDSSKDFGTKIVIRKWKPL